MNSHFFTAWDTVTDHLHQHRIPAPTSTAYKHIDAYLSQLADTNRIHNLVRYETPEELVWRHAVDSLAGLKAIRDYRQKHKKATIRLADIGTGGGFPGMPLALAAAPVNLTLVESVKKKAAFLREACEVLPLCETTVCDDRIETIAHDPTHREAYDIVTARALSALPVLVEYSTPLLKKGGHALWYKSATYHDEIAQAANALKKLSMEIINSYEYTIPAGDEVRTYAIVVAEKTAPTPKTYPRRVGIPLKKPL